MSVARQSLLAVGERTIDVSAGSLSGPDGVRRLEPRLVALLVCLDAANGGVVSRGALVEQVWDGRPVGDDAIDSAICRLRSAVGDRDRRLIQTVPKRGYRLVGRRSTQRESNSSLSLRGEVALSMWSSASTAHALSCFQAALIEVPTNSRAMAGAALARAMACYWGAPNSGELLDAAYAEAEAARNHSPEMAWGWLASGVAGFLRTGDVDAACEQLTRAFDSDPSIVLISIWRSLVLCANADFAAAVAEAERAQGLDPHGEGASANLVQTLFLARRYRQCAEAAAAVSTRFGGSLALRAYRGLALVFAGDEAAGIEVMSSSWRAGAGRSERLATLLRAFEEGGVSAYFKELAQITSSEHSGDTVRPIDRAILWALAGNAARAIEALDLAAARSDPRLRWIAAMPQLDSLHGMPEFEALRQAHAPLGCAWLQAS